MEETPPAEAPAPAPAPQSWTMTENGPVPTPQMVRAIQADVRRQRAQAAWEDDPANRPAPGKRRRDEYEAGDAPPPLGAFNVATPAEEDILESLQAMQRMARFSPGCLVVAMIYIQRLRRRVGAELMASTWQPTLLVSIVVAQKVWDDRCLSNADFSVIAASYTLKEVNDLEVKFLQLLQYNVSITASLYASYYFELRTLCEKAGPGRETAKPLSADAEKLLLREDAIKQLEVHSQNAQKEFQKDRRWQSHGGALMPSRVG